MLGVGVIGYGYWGPHLVRNFAETPGTAVRHVVDVLEPRLELVRRRYPAVRTGTDADQLIDDTDVHAVAIATPTTTHFELAMRALCANKHVLVEKPLATTVEQARLLVAEAERRKLTLMVDHTFVYTPAVRRIRNLITNGELGDVLYYDSTRINLGLFQHDVDVIWDLAVHDLSILGYLFDTMPVEVSAVGRSHVAGQLSNMAYLTLVFADNMIAHVNVNWLAPVKIRRTIIGGSQKMIVYDDLEPSDKVKIYDKGVDLAQSPEQVRRMIIGYRIGDMWAPQLDTTEALSLAAGHFVDCVTEQKRPDTSGEMGLKVVQVLEAASRSMQQQGQWVPVDTSRSTDVAS